MRRGSTPTHIFNVSLDPIKENALELNAECREHVQTFAMGFDQMIGGGVSNAQIEKVVKAYLTENEYVQENDLDGVVAEALKTAKDSGEFDGKDGEDAHTPVKGVDYFTESDKAELVNAVLESFVDVSEVGM